MAALQVPLPGRPTIFMSALTGGRPFGPRHELTVYLPIRALVDGPGDEDPVAMLRWLADSIERDGCNVVAFGQGGANVSAR
jgi:hypothetical protein